MDHPLISQGLSLRVVRSLSSNERALLLHSNNVKKLSVRIAQMLGFDPFEVRIVQFAATMHDISKLMSLYRPLFLSHSGKFSAVERKLANTHAYASAVAVLDLWNQGKIKTPFEIVAPGLVMIGGHHWAYHESESCYRRFLQEGQFESVTNLCVQKEEIPLTGARIIKVVDVFLARTESRPYLSEKPLSPQQAFEVIAAGAGCEFDPEVVAKLEQVYRSWHVKISSKRCFT